MSVSSLTVRRGVAASMIYLLVVGFGFFNLSRLPLAMLPELNFPVIAVITTYTGASPRDVETLVTEPIEQAVASVQNLERVDTISRQGSSTVLVHFRWGTDMRWAEQQVRKNLEIFAEDRLPTEATKPLTFAFDPSLSPVAFLAVDGPLDAYRMRRVAREEIEPYLARLQGVASAEVIGGREREIQVRLHPEWLQVYAIAPSQVTSALRAANVIVPGGSVDDHRQELTIEASGAFTSVEQIRDVVVGAAGGRPVLLSEVADVIDTFDEETRIVTANGQSAVLMAVRKQSDANTVQVAQAVLRALPDIETRLPEGVQIRPVFDEAEPILLAIGNLSHTALAAFLLTGIVLLLFLRSVRSSVIAVVAIPISVLVAFSVMQSLGVTLNLISMAGLALAVGMLVDNAIVVLESIFQRIERGESQWDAAISGAREMAMPITASTLTTVAVFAPILFVQGIAGAMFRDMALTICVALACSLMVALTLVPLMASRLLRPHQAGARPGRLARWTGFLDRLGPAYERRLAWALGHRKTIIAVTLGALIGSCAAAGGLGADFLPNNDRGDIRLEAEAAPGTSIEEMKGLVAQVEAMLAESIPESIVQTADYGVAEGFGALFGGAGHRASLRVKLPPRSARDRSQAEIEAALSERFREIPGLEIRIAGFAIGGAGGGDVQIKLYGDDLDVLRALGDRLKGELEDLPGAANVRFSMPLGRPELALDLDRERLRILGLSPAAVMQTVSTTFQGAVATFFREGGDEFAVRVRAPRAARADLASLTYLPLELPAGGTVPLGAVAELRDTLGPTDIERENQRRMASVFLDRKGVDLGTLVAGIERTLADIGLPEGVNIHIGGAAEDMQESFVNLFLALIVACFLVYMVMASQFESLLEPFVILFTIPLSSIGVVLALLITDTPLQVTAIIGVILLAGVVVNNGIVLIDTAKRFRGGGMELIEATREAGRVRMRPILMTAMTTILGMTPLALGWGEGSETWAPMGRSVVGGLIIATFLTLFVVPVIYVIIAGFAERRRARRAARRAARATAAA